MSARDDEALLGPSNARCRFCGEDMGASAVMLDPLDWIGHYGRCTKLDEARKAAESRPARPLGNCVRCCGTGRMPKFRHVENGLCFACGGSGNVKRQKASAS